MLLEQQVAGRPQHVSGYDAQKALDEELTRLGQAILIKDATPRDLAYLLPVVDGVKPKKRKKSDALAAGWGLQGTQWSGGEGP